MKIIKKYMVLGIILLVSSISLLFIGDILNRFDFLVFSCAGAIGISECIVKGFKLTENERRK